MSFSDWIGRTETHRDTIAAAPLRGLAAVLDREASWGEAAPPLAHWLYFLPAALQRELGPDGHPKRGGFLPPVELPRRMWAGGRLQFHAPLPVGADAERISTIKSITPKTGASGDMVFVTVAHEVRVDGRAVIGEEQDIVYRAGAAAPARAGTADTRASTHTREFRPDETQLFRFSALTFNAHRIHYDRAYATEVEGYPGLVVQGPLIATVLMHHFLGQAPRAAVRGFSFRAQKPLFAGEAARLCGDGAGEVWCLNAAGEAVMNATVEAG